MKKFKEVSSNQKFAEMEQSVLEKWRKEKTFVQSIENRKDAKEYTFFDGPPFATGLPHYGHIVASVIKDVVPRYWTMRGYRVERKWGWDCHGLPIENIVEKALGSKKKKDIEIMGVDVFNEKCRETVLTYAEEWKKTIERVGRWADMDHAYMTMDNDYMESVWWVFKQLWDKGLIYKDYRSMHICPRCETTLSQQEVSEGYMDIKDLSVIAEFRLLDEKNTSILAWTTTPWTLPGNVALAVGENIDYVTIEKKDEGVGELVRFIVAKDLVKKIFGDDEYRIVAECKGKELVGKKYTPLFDCYSKNTELNNHENGWKIHTADFVTTDEGTGVVHIAPAFGADDMRLGKEKELPFVQHVAMDGSFKEEMGELAGLNVKPIDDHQSTDVAIIKYLAQHGMLFHKEKYEHSYPHCWRCDTPLINYATSSWFVKVTQIKERALEHAKNITWSPEHMKEGRFGNWLSGAQDWSISRQRFWASVMPIWECEQCGDHTVVGSVAEISEHFGNPNMLHLVRHGEAQNNVKDVLNSDRENNVYHLTEKGKEDVMLLAQQLKEAKIDAIYASPMLRTQETAQIIADVIGVPVMTDERLMEIKQGALNGKTEKKFHTIFPTWPQDDGTARVQYGMETEQELLERLVSFVEEINIKYRNQNIVVVTHGDPLQVMRAYLKKEDRVTTYHTNYPRKGSVYRVYSKFVDLHKHVVDHITLSCTKCGGMKQRVPDVLDTWFDSGSMPYAQKHYPFENVKHFEENFPADFIAEGVDQTRAWFYYLHVLATSIKDHEAFRNVIVNGIVLAEDGKKMAKKLKNYPDPGDMFEKYGADSMRYYLMQSPVVAAENLNFRESEVAEITRGMMRMLWNSYAFFVLYANIDGFIPQKKFEPSSVEHVLDRWIISVLHVLIRDMNTHMEQYELHRTARLLSPFIDHLSNWYVRRSRSRFWKSENDGDKNDAYATLHYVLVELSKLMAPFTPFISEEIYTNLTGEKSVHLVDYPHANPSLIKEGLNAEMSTVRDVISEGLKLRARTQLKVRQPLQKLSVEKRKWNVTKDMEMIIIEELNVKEIVVVEKINGEEKNIGEINEIKVMLDINVTDILKREGYAREIIRYVQQMRKKAGYNVDDRIHVGIVGMESVIDEHQNIIVHEVLADVIMQEDLVAYDLMEKCMIDGEQLTISLKKNS